MTPIACSWSALDRIRKLASVLVVLILLLGKHGTLKAQVAWTRVLGHEAGHPAHSTYALHIDRTGLLWLSTERGVLSYDGVRFRTMAGSEVMNDALILEFTEDSLSGQLWLAAQDGRIFRWDRAGEQLIAYGRGPGAGGPMTRLRTMRATTSGGLLVAYDRGSGMDELGSDGIWRQRAVPDGREGLHVAETPSGTVFYSNWNPLPERLQVHVAVGPIRDTRSLLRGQREPWAFFNNWQRTLDGGVVISVGPDLLWWSPDGSFRQERYGRHVNRIHLDGHGRVWTLEYLGRVRCYGTDGALTDIRLPALDGVHATDVAHDGFGGLWISTLGAGLHYLRPFDVEVLSVHPDGAPFTAMSQAPDGGVVTGDLHGVVRHWNSSMEQVAEWRLSVAERPVEVKGVHWCEQHHGPEASAPYLIGMFGPSGSNIRRTSLIRGSYAYTLHHLGGDSLLVLSPYGLTLLPSGPSGPIHDLYLGGRMFQLASWRDGLWIAGAQGLFVLNKALQFNGPVLDVPMSDVLVWQGSMVAASSAMGLYRRDRAGAWKAWEPHPWARATRDLFAAEDGSLWLATSKGVIGLDMDGQVIWTSDVFPGLEIDGADRIVVGGEKVWMLSHRAIYRMSRHASSVGHGLRPPEFTAVQVHERMLRPSEVTELRPDDRDVTIHFRASMPFRLGKEAYRVRIDDERENWSVIDAPRIDLFNLGAGRHRVEVQAAMPGGAWGGVGVLEFLVPPHWYETWWVRTAVVCIALFLTAIFTQWRVRAARLKADQHRTMTDLRMQALTAQLEPHFVFNALNGIQGYLARNEKEIAMRYLARFSRLMRGLLEAGKSPMISLREEIELLDHYCNLEAMRFTAPFEWSIVVSPDLDAERTGLLPYMVQPYVENAVRHGLWHRTGGEERRLSVTFRRHGSSMMCCLIEDTGVGREQAKKLARDPARRPVGWAVNLERLKLLTGYPEPPDAVIEDVMDPDGRAKGTRVTLLLPILPVPDRKPFIDGGAEQG